MTLVAAVDCQAYVQTSDAHSWFWPRSIKNLTSVMLHVRVRLCCLPPNKIMLCMEIQASM